jgi:membrane fusion protein (multidrug efflux system)
VKSGRILRWLVLLCLILGLGYFGYARYTAPPATPTAKAAPPPPQVGVATINPADVPLTFIYAGRVASYRAVEIRSQVGGVLLKKEFREGDRVAVGQVLFRIDQNPYRVALDRANATLLQSQATLRQAQENLARAEELQRRGAGTEKALQDAQATRDQSQAAVQLSQADVRNAQLNLDYTNIAAPVAGLTSLTTPPEGTLVQAQQTILTTVTQLDPAYVNYSITDGEYQQFRALNQTRDKPVDPETLTVKLQLGDGKIYEHTGRFEVSSNTINPQTGTLQLRAVFPNPDGAILPGQIVRVIITGIELPKALVVPKAAVSQGPQGPFVYKIETNNVAQALPIRLGQDVGDSWVIDDGLKSGDRIVVDGLVRVRPGSAVTPATPQGKVTADQGASGGAGR